MKSVVYSYVHMGGKIGVLVEVACESDFVARGEEFQSLCRDICLQICAASPMAVSWHDLNPSIVAKKRALYLSQAADTGRPPAACEKIAEGKLKAWYSEVCLLSQQFVKDSDKTISQLIADFGRSVGEQVFVRRFVRYAAGKGMAGSGASD